MNQAIKVVNPLISPSPLIARKLSELNKMEDNLPQELAMKLAKKIRPVISGASADELKFSIKGKPEGTKFWVAGGDIFHGSYANRVVPIMPAEHLNKVTEIITYHGCSSCGRVVPSVYEVLSQIPDSLRNVVTAFELYANVSSWSEIYNAELDRHVLNCILYRGNVPAKVAKQQIFW